MAPDPETPAARFHARLAASLASPRDHSTTRPLDHLPLLSPADSHTLTTYLFTHNANLPAAAAALEISPTDLNTFLHLPHIAAHLASLEAAQAKHDIRAALDTLKHAATTPDAPAEPRRAATAILRFHARERGAPTVKEGFAAPTPPAPRAARCKSGTTTVPDNNNATARAEATDVPRLSCSELSRADAPKSNLAPSRATEIALDLGGSRASLAHPRATGSAGSAAVLVPTAPTSPRPTHDVAAQNSTTNESRALDPNLPPNLSDLPAWLEARRAEHEAKAQQYHDEAQEVLRELAYASARRRGVDLSKEDPIATYVFRGKLLSPIINKRINRSRPPPRFRYRIPAC